MNSLVHHTLTIGPPLVQGIYIHKSLIIRMWSSWSTWSTYFYLLTKITIWFLLLLFWKSYSDKTWWTSLTSWTLADFQGLTPENRWTLWWTKLYEKGGPV